VTTTHGPDPLLELAVGLLMLVAVILIHGIGLRIVNQRFARAWSRLGENPAHWRANLYLGVVVGALAALHLLETFVFAAPLTLTGVFPELRDSYYYVLESYTTLGEGSLSLPERWRLLGPMIAMCGLLTFGWTGSVLVSIMTRYGILDSRQARESLDREREQGDAAASDEG